MPDPTSRPATALLMDADKAPPLLIDVGEVCRLLSVGRTCLHDMRRCGRFPLHAIHIGRRAVRFSADELSRWVSAGCPNAERWRAMNAVAMRRTG